MKKERNIMLIGTYLSQSGIELEFKIEEPYPAWDEKNIINEDYIVFFTNGGHSASLAKLDLKTMWDGLNGKLFFISKEELDDLRDKVIGKTGKWSIKDMNENTIELPGQWLLARNTQETNS